MIFDADYAGIQTSRISNKTAVQCIASPPPLSLAYFCELELGNNLAARGPNSMISRSLNERCANCSITTLTCYNAATQPIASNLNTWTRLSIRSTQHRSPLQRSSKTINLPRRLKYSATRAKLPTPRRRRMSSINSR